jgi:hypothetical protein
MKFAPPKVIAVDVDGTLHTNGIANEKVIALVSQEKSGGLLDDSLVIRRRDARQESR